MPPKRKPGGPVPVEAIKHRDKRVNIPTEELREFVRAKEELIRVNSTTCHRYGPRST